MVARIQVYTPGNGLAAMGKTKFECSLYRPILGTSRPWGNRIIHVVGGWREHINGGQDRFQVHVDDSDGNLIWGKVFTFKEKSDSTTVGTFQGAVITAHLEDDGNTVRVTIEG